ncbi:MAG: GntR family transcriptional regulator [Pararhizobium sp.]
MASGRLMDEVSGHRRGKSPKEDIIYERILELIMDKFLRPGQRLNEAKLAEVHAVPRSRVRRVLERLRDEEIVTFELNKGAFLCRPTVEEAHDVFETRRHLEYAAARLACERATATEIAALRDQIRREQEVFDTGRRDANRIAGEFHDLLARTTKNPILEKTLVGLVRRCVLIQSIYEVESKVLCLTGEHEQIVQAIESKDAETAVSLMAHHFDHIIASLDLSEDRERETDIYAQMQ